MRTNQTLNFVHTISVDEKESIRLHFNFIMGLLIRMTTKATIIITKMCCSQTVQSYLISAEHSRSADVSMTDVSVYSQCRAVEQGSLPLLADLYCCSHPPGSVEFEYQIPQSHHTCPAISGNPGNVYTQTYKKRKVCFFEVATI